MPRRTQRRSNFPQLGGPGEYYQVTRASGEPALRESGNPLMAWRYGNMPKLEEPHEVAAATANLVHSIRSASPGEVKHGMEWYPRVHEAVRKGIRSKAGFLSGASNKMMSGAAIVAAVSPNMDWERNNIGAFKELASLRRQDWTKIHQGDMSPVKGMSISAAPSWNLQKAGRVIAGSDPMSEFHPGKAPKTLSFMHNIADPSNPDFVTIDGRAFDTLTNRMRSWETNRNLSTGAKSLPQRYAASRNIFQGVAGEMGIHPSAAQAISWSHTKYDIEQASRTRKQGPHRIGQPYFHPQTGAPAAFPGQYP
jgi:hypothetical protein